MRVIKFRAYLKDSALAKMKDSRVWSASRLMEVERIDFENKRVGFNRVNGLFWFDLKDVELLQFTGLHDKNGKEIWEGDILAHTSWVQNKANGSPGDDYSDHKVIEGVPLNLNKNPFPINRDFIYNPYRVVQYIAHDEFYDGTGFFSPFIGSHKPKHFEVLGNIYENPELTSPRQSSLKEGEGK